MGAPRGLATLEAACPAYLSYVERRVFPGGCCFAAPDPAMDARAGPVHDAASALARQWNGWLQALATEAQQRGEIVEDVDVAQLAFELDGCLELANYHMLFGEARAIERGSEAVAAILGRPTQQSTQSDRLVTM